MTTQLANDAVTEPKLAASNSPGTNQVLGWSGSSLQWVSGGGGGFSVSAWDNASTYSIGNIVTQNSRAFMSRVDNNTGNDPDLEASAASWFLIRTGEEIVHAAGRFYAPGTVVNGNGRCGGCIHSAPSRPRTRQANSRCRLVSTCRAARSILEATTTASPYRSGTLVYHWR